MIPSLWSWLSKSRWWAWREAQLRAACAQQEASLQQELEARRALLERQAEELARDVEELVRRQQERKEELARANEDLRTQLRLLEAKAAPDHVWAEAFSLGFSKAWDLMVPLMTEGLDQLKERIRTQAIEETLQNLTPTHRLLSAQTLAVRSTVELLQKREEFQEKRAQAQGAAKERYEHYLQTLDWVLQAMTNGH